MIAFASMYGLAYGSCVDDDRICSSNCAGKQACLNFCASQMLTCAANSEISERDASSGLTADDSATKRLPDNTHSNPITYVGNSTASFADQTQSCEYAESAAQRTVGQYLDRFVRTGNYVLSITDKHCECTSSQRYGRTMYDCIGYVTGVADPSS
jgi:hypothetical protein